MKYSLIFKDQININSSPGNRQRCIYYYRLMIIYIFFFWFSGEDFRKVGMGKKNQDTNSVINNVWQARSVLALC